MKDGKLPLGRETSYPDRYSPELLFAIPRADSRLPLGLTGVLPFSGVDLWNAWELTWLDTSGQPIVATAEIEVPADSPNIVESKSLKLYLNSFAMSQFSSAAEVGRAIASDLCACAGRDVRVAVSPVIATEGRPVSRLAGLCLDTLDVACETWQVDADLLRADPETIVSEDLYTHLLRSLCPVTAQPDIGSVQICYRGPRIDPAGLLRYLVSYRQHAAFHETCVERMFLDITARCAPEALSVHARYQRRGGLDINPFRSSEAGDRPVNRRLWRQ